jgi:hypothetical protein
VHSPFWRETTQTARLVHRCDDCHFPIIPGEEYVTISGVWDGEFATYRSHVLCNMLAARLRDDEGCRYVGNLCETVNEVNLTPLQARWASSLLGRNVTTEEDGEC